MVPTAFDSSSSLYQSSFTPPSSSSPYQSFTPPSSSPPTGLSPSLPSFTPPSTTRQRRTILVTMGPCNWRGKNDGFRCLCASGSCTSDLDASRAFCDNCMHPMSMHSDYAFSPAVLESASSHPPSRQIIPFEIQPFVNSRTELVDETIARVEHYHIIQVRGTPASGKTTVMKLVANKLLEMYGHESPIHVLYGWNREKVGAVGWNAYLEQVTGIRGDAWPARQAYLLLDEAQESYWDSELWAAFFKSVERVVSAPSVILFSSYGSPGRGYVGFGEQKYIKTPMVFAPEQQISLRPDKGIDNYLRILLRSGKSTELQACRPVGLLLKEDEAIDVLTRYASAGKQPSLSADLKRELFLISGGHAGLLTSLVDVLCTVPELYALVRKNTSLDLQTTREHLFNQPLKLFQYIRGTAFTRGLPKPEILQNSAAARVFKKVIAYDGISESDCENENEELKNAFQNIWRNGWLNAEKSNHDVRYVFATKIHRWYCACLFHERAPDGEIRYDTPLELAIDAIMQFRPRQLSDAPRSSAGYTPPPEDQYQKEFYRCLFTILDGRVVLSPEYAIRTGTKGGTIDFLVARKKWGLELLRYGDRLVGHMERFKPGGQYFSMIESGDMEEYIVLDFRDTQPTKPHPEYQGRLYHVVFSQNFREVEVIDASDLSIVKSFVLTENANPIV